MPASGDGLTRGHADRRRVRANVPLITVDITVALKPGTNVICEARPAFSHFRWLQIPDRT
jgi:hypothetical protein